MKKLSICLVAMFLLSGCWGVKSHKLTLKFDAKKGSGSFVQDFSGLTCEEKGKDCGEANFGDLEKMGKRYVKMLSSLGSTNLKTEFKIGEKKGSYNAKLSGKYGSLTQLQFFWQELRASYKEIPGNRTDLVLQLTFEPKGAFKADTFGFELVSTDPSATIEEATPVGKMDAGHHSVSWDSLPAQGETATVTVRLKGQEMPN